MNSQPVGKESERRQWAASESGPAQLGAILTLNANSFHPLWIARASLLSGYSEYFLKTRWASPWKALGGDIYWGWRLFRESRHYAAVFTCNERCSWVFALLQLFRGKWRVPHFQLEFVWNPPASALARMLKRTMFRFEQRAVDGIVVFSKEQAARYSSYFPFAAGKFRAIPFHTTLPDSRPRPLSGAYVFAGGDTGRDYRILIEAVRGTDWQVIIAALKRYHFDGIDIPHNVSVITTNGQEFAELTARAGVVVVPLSKDLLHVGGHQTYLNAMALGKCVVVADDCGAREYIRDGIDGFVVEAGDAATLRSRLAEVMGSAELRDKIGRQARERAAAYSPERFFLEAFRMADERCAQRPAGGG